MATTVQKEIVRRGVFGHIVKWVFILFNIAMIVWLISYFSDAGEIVTKSQSDAERTGAGLGMMFGTGFILIVWAIINVILVALVFLTRRKELVTITKD